MKTHIIVNEDIAQNQIDIIVSILQSWNIGVKVEKIDEPIVDVSTIPLSVDLWADTEINEPKDWLENMSIEEKVLHELRILNKKINLVYRQKLQEVKIALSMNDAVLVTGLSKSHLYKLVFEKKIPYYKSPGGKLTYFHRDELNDWMLKQRQKTKNE